jgi:general secretion pathway protein C
MSEKINVNFSMFRRRSVGKYLPRGLLIAGVILLAWQLATMTWFLSDTDQPSEAPAVIEPEKKATPVAAPKQAEAYDLFEVEQKIPVKVDKPVRRNSNLLLHGVIAGVDPKQGSALISPPNATPQVYRVGEQVSPGITLDEIYPHHVLLLHGNFHELLALPKDNLGLSANAGNPSALAGEPVVVKAPQVTRKLARYRKQLKDNPMALARLLRGKPVMRNGSVYGIQVSRGSDPTLIDEIGLQDKDILLSLNDIALNDIKQLPTLIKILSEEDRFAVMLERKGVTRSMNIYLEM